MVISINAGNFQGRHHYTEVLEVVEEDEVEGQGEGKEGRCHSGKGQGVGKCREDKNNVTKMIIGKCKTACIKSNITDIKTNDKNSDTYKRIN